MKKDKNIESKISEGLQNFKQDGGDLHKVLSNLNEKIDNLVDAPQNDSASDPKVSDSTDTPQHNYHFGWMIALLIVGIIGTFVFAKLMQPKTKRPDKIYANYFSPFPNVLTSIERGENGHDQGAITLEKAMKLYQEEKYSEAINEFERFQGDSDLEKYTSYYRAISHLAQNETTPAIRILEALQGDQEVNNIQDGIQWYLALAYLKKGDEQISIKYFSELPSDHYKAKEIKEILETIRTK